MDTILFFLCALISGGVKLFHTARKFLNFRRYCKVYNYSFAGFYEKIGLEYRREVPYMEVLNLLNEHNITAILFPKDFKIFEYLVIVDFPYHEERCGFITCGHGGIRLFHFYSLVVKVDNQAKCRPYDTLYIEEDKGIFISPLNLTNGKYLDTVIKASAKDALLGLIEEGKYWNGGERVYSKYDGLIQLFLAHHKDFDVYEESPCKVKLSDYTNKLYVHLEQKYKENNVDKLLSVSMFNLKGFLFDVTKDFAEDEDFNTIFCSVSNEFTKENIRLSYNLENGFVKEREVPTTRLLSDSEVIGALHAYTEEARSLEHEVYSIEDEQQESSIICLTDFIEAHGSISVEDCVNNEDGNIEKLCIFTNAPKDRTFVCFSPYLGEVPINELKEKEEEFYVCQEKEGCYFLCTKETNEYKMGNLDTWPYFETERKLEQLLTDLNVQRAFTKYTITNVNNEL